MESTEFQSDTTTKLRRVAWLSSRNPDCQFDNLMHHYNVASLEDCYHRLDGKKAVGTDRVTKSQYGEQLNENLELLLDRMKSMSYRPSPVRQVQIPKPGKGHARRPLGISNFEDKLFQSMTQRILESIYEPLFRDCSYGFRPGRSCHDAIKALHTHLFYRKVTRVIDVDLRGFFDTIDHDLLQDLLKQKIKDKRFMRYINRMLRAGVLSEGELSTSDEGVPQGSVCSPVLSNIFAHYVIDEWFEDVVKPHCRGEVAIFRYCDDAVICCQLGHDAKRIIAALEKRLSKYKLELNTEKTHSVSYCRAQASKGVKQGTFDFLGFTFFLGRTYKGTILPRLKSSGKRMSAKLQRVKEWVRKSRHKYRLLDLWKVFCIKLQGHIRYYGVSFNTRYVNRFIEAAKRIVLRWINRRSHRRSYNWEQFNSFLKSYPIPKPRVYHALF